jgi:hypothetical protein
MLTWTPDPAAAPWHDAQADEIWTAGPITAMDAEGLLAVTGYSCEVVGPAPLSGLCIQAGTGGVTVSAPQSLASAFPAVDIEYQIKGVTGHCATFSELPPEADEVIRFAPCPSNAKDWTLRVTAHCGAGVDDSADFILRVWANFNPGRNALQEAIHARRRQMG